MKEENLTGQESLQIINSMIKQAKNHYHESGMSALLWGFTNVICFTLAYLQNTVEGFNLPFSPFFLMILTFALQVYYDRKQNDRKRSTAVTYLDDAHKFVWMGFGIVVTILTIVGGIVHLGYFTLPILMLLFGLPTFISGCISKFPAMIIGGILCWIFSIIAFVYEGYYAFLLCAASATVAWIIPGFILRKRFKKQNLIISK